MVKIPNKFSDIDIEKALSRISLQCLTENWSLVLLFCLSPTNTVMASAESEDIDWQVRFYLLGIFFYQNKTCTPLRNCEFLWSAHCKLM